MKNIIFIRFLKNNPSLVILIGLLTGIIPAIIFSSSPFYHAILASLIIATIFFFFTNTKIGTKIILWCIVGMAIIPVYKNCFYADNYSALIPFRNCSAQVKAIVTDPELTTSNWLPPPKYIKMKVLAVRYNSKEKWIPASGIIKVNLPKLHAAPRSRRLVRRSLGEGENTTLQAKARPGGARFHVPAAQRIAPPPTSNGETITYGELLLLDGSFIQPQDAPFQGSFDYRKYLKSQGINKLFISSDYTKLGLAGFPYNIYRDIYSIRDFTLNSLCAGITSAKTKGFLAGFFFGCRQGITKQLKQTFLRSGTIHILAISGLHVGILALILLFIFRFIPITPRYLIVPGMLFCYVFLTGFRPSGLRALIMISILCFHKALFSSIRPVNTIAFAAVLILLLNPFAINNTGFQFSFIITGLLVLSWAKVNDLAAIIEEKNRWTIFTDFSFFKKLGFIFRKKLSLLIITSTIAGLAGTGLILYYQSLFIPSMILSNILILPLLLPLFIIGGIKIVLFSILGTTLIPLDSLLNGIVSMITHVANWGAYSLSTQYYQQPPIIFLLIFYFALAGIFFTKKKKKVLIFISLTIGMLIVWLSANIFSPANITIIQGAGDVPPAIIIKPNSYNNPILINCPDKLANIIVNKLRKAGINSLDAVIVTRTSKPYSAGIPKLLTQMPIKQVIFGPKAYKTKTYKQIKSLCKKYSIEIVEQKDTHPNEWNISGNKLEIKKQEINPGFNKLSVSVNNKKADTFNIKNSNTIQIFESPIQ